MVIVAVLGIVLLPRISGDRPPFDPAAVPGTQVVGVTAPVGADHGTLQAKSRPDRIVVDDNSRGSSTITSNGRPFS